MFWHFKKMPHVICRRDPVRVFFIDTKCIREALLSYLAFPVARPNSSVEIYPTLLPGEFWKLKATYLKIAKAEKH